MCEEGQQAKEVMYCPPPRSKHTNSRECWEARIEQTQRLTELRLAFMRVHLTNGCHKAKTCTQLLYMLKHMGFLTELQDVLHQLKQEHDRIAREAEELMAQLTSSPPEGGGESSHAEINNMLL